MYGIVQLLIRYNFFILFLTLETTAVMLTFGGYNYHKTAVNTSALSWIGMLHAKRTKLEDYFKLEEVNQALVKENTDLKAQLKESYFNKTATYTFKEDTLNFRQKFQITSAKVINNTISRNQNYITLNRGTDDGIDLEMGVVSNKGVVGKVVNVSKNYARVLSMLNVKTRINARIVRSHYFGVLQWDGKSSQYVQLNEVPRYVDVKVGDIVETDGKSAIYPEGIPIGKITHVSLDKTIGNHQIQVKLFQDFANLGYCYVIKNLDQLQIQQVENTDALEVKITKELKLKRDILRKDSIRRDSLEKLAKSLKIKDTLKNNKPNE
ncbi:MAG: rod shape-determining protein MreC [Flavobacteriaceae bacterium]|nr:MAG: rod shape-determining protein MreC [Flavobacteriaceae bacterium]